MSKGNKEAHGRCRHCGEWREDVAQEGLGQCLRCRYEDLVYRQANLHKSITTISRGAVWAQFAGGAWILRCPPAKGTMTIRALCINAYGELSWGVPDTDYPALSFKSPTEAMHANNKAPMWWPRVEWKARPRKLYGELVASAFEEVSLVVAE